MCKLISHEHTLAFSFVNIICVNCINIFSLLYSTVLCIIYVPLYYVLFLLEEIKNYYYYYYYSILAFYYSILAFYYSILAFYYSILAFYNSILAFYYSILAFYNSILAFYYSILAFNITRIDAILMAPKDMIRETLLFWALVSPRI